MEQDSQKVIIITGASSGIGKQLALKYAKRKSRLVIAARSTEILNRVAEECRKLGSEVIAVTADVSKTADCKNIVDQTIKAFSKIDLLILDAGVSFHAPFESVSDVTLYKTMMDINYLGYVYCTYYALPYLKKSRGQIGVVNSLSGELGLPLRTGYCATKFATKGFFEALRTEISHDIVAISIVSPGSVATEMRQHALKDGNSHIEFNEPDEKKMPVEECAKKIVEAFDMRKKNAILTTSGKIGVYAKPFLPSLVEYFAVKKAGGRAKL